MTCDEDSMEDVILSVRVGKAIRIKWQRSGTRNCLSPTIFNINLAAEVLKVIRGIGIPQCIIIYNSSNIYNTTPVIINGQYSNIEWTTNAKHHQDTSEMMYMYHQC